VGRIEIAQNEDAAPSILLPCEEFEESTVEAEFEWDTAVVAVGATTLGEVDVRHQQLSEPRKLEPRLDVESPNSQRCIYRIRRYTREEANAAVTATLPGNEGGVPTTRLAHMIREIFESRTNFLDTDNVST
jgi:hypothetical protein